MDFEFTDEQQALRDAVRRWAERDFRFERRKALAGAPLRPVHQELAGLGLTALQVPAQHGGAGCGAVEAMVVMEELGRALVHAPYAAAALLAPALLAPAPPPLHQQWLPRIADGSALVVPALQEPAARYRLDRVETTAVHAAHGWTLSGRKGLVPAGDEADAYLVPARCGDGLGLFVAGRAGVAVHAYATQDGARAAELTFAAAPAELVTTDGRATLELAADIGIAAACAEGVGLMDRLVAMTVDYMNTRRQFGVPIASFQALRHRIADVVMQLELGRSMSYYATLKLGEPAPVRRRALSQAKVQLGQSMRHVGQQCIQLHGGIGMTDEYAASHYFKRLTMLELAHGDTLHHLGEVSDRLQDSAGVLA